MPEPLDRKALSAALANLVRRHEIMRTRFVPRADGPPAQQVLEDMPAPITWAGRSWQEVVDVSTVEPFDLTRPPLFRVVVADLHDGGYGVFLVMHHIITDRWSMDIFARDLFEFYAAMLAGREPRLLELPIQYGDYALWQQRLLDSAVVQSQFEHWQQTMAGYAPLKLPVDRPHSTTHDIAGQEVVVELSDEFTNAMVRMAWRTRGSPAVVVTAALGAMLSALTRQTDIVVGAVMSDRPRPELQNLIGCFVSIVVLRIVLTQETLTFREIVKNTRDAWLAADAYRDIPFEKLATTLETRPEAQQNPIFNVLVNHGGGWPDADSDSGMPPPWDAKAPDTATFELSQSTLMVNTLVLEGRLRVAFVYRTSMLDRSTVDTLVSSFVRLLEQGVADPDQPLSLHS